MAIAVVNDDELACVYIPCARGGLLVPQESVAEILRTHEVQPRSEVPDWLLGSIDWRGLTVPVVSFDAMKGDSETRRHCMVVLNRAQDLPALPFYAVMSSDVPRLMRIAEEDLQQHLSSDKSEVVATSVRLGDDVAFIPRLKAIEDWLQPFLPH